MTTLKPNLDRNPFPIYHLPRLPEDLDPPHPFNSLFFPSLLKVNNYYGFTTIYRADLYGVSDDGFKLNPLDFDSDYYSQYDEYAQEYIITNTVLEGDKHGMRYGETTQIKYRTLRQPLDQTAMDTEATELAKFFFPRSTYHLI